MIKLDKIIEGWKIESDGTQYILSKCVTRTKEKDGEKYESKSDQSYYTTMTGLIQGLHRKIMLNKIKDTDYTLNEALRESTAVWQRIEAELKGF
jgi:hypothetical protein